MYFKTKLIDKNTEELFELYRVKNSAQIYQLLFLIRRYSIMLILVGMPTLKYAQIFGQILSTAVVICYLWAFQPFENGFHNTKEILNEVIVIIAAYPLFMCTAWINDEKLRIDVGWFIVACIGASMLFNIGSLLVVTARKMI